MILEIIRICSPSGGDGSGLTLSLIALVVGSTPVRMELHVYNMSLPVDVVCRGTFVTAARFDHRGGGGEEWTG